MNTHVLNLSDRTDTEIARALVALGYDRVRNVFGILMALSEEGVRMGLVSVLIDTPRALGAAVEHASQSLIAQGLQGLFTQKAKQGD